MDNLLRLNLVSYVPLGDKNEGEKDVNAKTFTEVISIFQTAKKSLLITPIAKIGSEGKAIKMRITILLLFLEFNTRVGNLKTEQLYYNKMNHSQSSFSLLHTSHRQCIIKQEVAGQINPLINLNHLNGTQPSH